MIPSPFLSNKFVLSTLGYCEIFISAKDFGSGRRIQADSPLGKRAVRSAKGRGGLAPERARESSAPLLPPLTVAHVDPPWWVDLVHVSCRRPHTGVLGRLGLVGGPTLTLTLNWVNVVVSS